MLKRVLYLRLNVYQPLVILTEEVELLARIESDCRVVGTLTLTLILCFSCIFYTKQSNQSIITLITFFLSDVCALFRPPLKNTWDFIWHSVAPIFACRWLSCWSFIDIRRSRFIFKFHQVSSPRVRKLLEFQTQAFAFHHHAFVRLQFWLSRIRVKECLQLWFWSNWDDRTLKTGLNGRDF